jgi:integrase
MRRNDSSFLQLNKRIPTDVVGKARGITLSVPVGDKVVTKRITGSADKVTLSLGTRDPAEAKARQAAAVAYLERVWAGLRAGPVRLTHKQAVALSGRAYRAFANGLEDSPKTAALWEGVLAANRAAVAGKLSGVASLLLLDDDGRKRVALEQRFGEWADVILAGEGLQVDAESRHRLIVELARSMTDAAEKLKRNAEGDYRPDPNSERFPTWVRPDAPDTPKTAAKAGTLKGLLEDWWSEAQRAGRSPRTYDAYRTVVTKLVAFLGHDNAAGITPEDIIRFKDHRLTEASAKTVKDSDLVGLKTVFGWGVTNRRLAANPAAGVTVIVGRKPKLRPSGFTDDEAKAILAAANAYQGSPGERAYTVAAKRWAPWLCAYTGARIGEIVQLRKVDVRRQDGIWAITITPEAGAVKDGEVRTVPIHPHLIEMGFPEFVQAAAEGPLFIRAGGDVRGRVRAGANRLREFVRGVVMDTRVQPSHGWRHRLKTVGREVGISDTTLDAICGHAPATVGAGYGETTLKAMAAAIAKLPRYQV